MYICLQFIFFFCSFKQLNIKLDWPLWENGVIVCCVQLLNEYIYIYVFIYTMLILLKSVQLQKKIKIYMYTAYVLIRIPTYVRMYTLGQSNIFRLELKVNSKIFPKIGGFNCNQQQNVQHLPAIIVKYCNFSELHKYDSYSLAQKINFEPPSYINVCVVISHKCSKYVYYVKLMLDL